MSGLPGYYVSDPLAIVTLPVAPNWSAAVPKGPIAEQDVASETAAGQLWAKKLYSLREYDMPFTIIGDTDLAVYKALHELVGGQATPFRYVFDVTESPANVVLVRKEPDFAYTSHRVPAMSGGGVKKVYEYVMRLQLELVRMNMPLKLDGISYPNDTRALYDALPDATLITDEDETVELEYAAFSGGILLSGTPVQVFYGHGWIEGQIETLRNADITPYLVPGTADYYDWYYV